MNLLQALGVQKTDSEKFIDTYRPDYDIEIEVTVEDFEKGTPIDPQNSPLARAVERAILGTDFKLQRAGLKVIILSKGLYEYAYFLPRSVWRKINSRLVYSDPPHHKHVKFTATFSLLF